MIVDRDLEFVTVFASTDRQYSVSFNVDGGIISSSIMKYDDVPEAPADPIKQLDAYYNYVFDRWSPSIGVVKGDTTYTAVFTATPRTYTVTWLDDEDNVMDTTTGLTYGSMPAYTKGTVTKASTAEFSYTFKNWSPQVKAVTSDATYTAIFDSSRNTYSVTWKDDTGKVLWVPFLS